MYAVCALAQLGSLKLVTKFASESGSITATTRTDGYSAGYHCQQMDLFYQEDRWHSLWMIATIWSI